MVGQPPPPWKAAASPPSWLLSPGTHPQLARAHQRRQLDAALLFHHHGEEEVGDGHQDAGAVACTHRRHHTLSPMPSNGTAWVPLHLRLHTARHHDARLTRTHLC